MSRLHSYSIWLVQGINQKLLFELGGFSTTWQKSLFWLYCFWAAWWRVWDQKRNGTKHHLHWDVNDSICGDDNGCNLKSRPWIPSSLFSRPDSCPQWWSSRRFPAISFSNLSFCHRGNVRNIVEPQKKKIVNKTQSEAPILWSSFATFSLLTGEVCKMQVRTWQFAAHQENLFCKSYKLGPVDNSVVTSSAIEALWCFWWWYFYACKANKDILFKISSILLISFIGLRKMSPCRLSCLGGASAQTWE